MYRTWGVCLLPFNTFLARKTSLSASSSLRHHRDSMWMNLRLFHCKYGTVSLVICNVTAPIKAVHQAFFFSYRTQWLNDSANVGCFIASVCGLPRSSGSEQQVSHYDACVCLRCWNKWIGLLPLLVVVAFKQTLKRTVVCSRYNATKPSH